MNPSRGFRPLAILLAAAVSGVMSAPSPALAAPLPSLSIDDVSVTEGDAGTVTLNFTVRQDSRGKSTVRYSTAAGTASSPEDFLARTGTLRFSGGHRKNKVAVTISSDTLDEADETFSVRLTNAVGATIADGEGRGTITDDDVPPMVSAAATLTVPEGNSGDTPIAAVDVILSGPSGRQVSVDFTTVDGTATSASDYDLTAGTLEFAPGQLTKSVAVSVQGDDLAEGDETFDLDLVDPVHATLGSDTTVVTIQDNDPIPPGSAVLNVSGGTIREGTGGTKSLTFTVTRSGETTTAVDVDYQTTNGTAITARDYLPAAGNLSFAADVTTATIELQILGDRRLEHRERFFLSLINPSAGAAIDDGQASGRIRDNDTWTRFKMSKTSRLIRVRGRLSPAHPGKLMTVTLSRRKDGEWVRLATKRPELEGRSDLNGDGFTDSRFAAQFPRPNSGRCRIVVTFRGDSSHGPSSSTQKMNC